MDGDNERIQNIKAIPVDCKKGEVRKKKRWSGRGDLNPRPPSPELGEHDCYKSLKIN